MTAFRAILTVCLAVVTLAANIHHANAQVLGTVNFDFDSDALTPQAQQTVTEIAQRIRTDGALREVVVIGHTDAVGSADYNEGLGLRRAQNVARALTAQGIAVSQIGTVETRGERDLLVQVTVPERRNRRVNVSYDEMMAACRTFRGVLLPETDAGQLGAGLRDRLNNAAEVRRTLAGSGASSAVFQVAGAAVEDCSTAVGFRPRDGRFEEYAKRCICNHARISMLQ